MTRTGNEFGRVQNSNTNPTPDTDPKLLIHVLKEKQTNKSHKNIIEHQGVETKLNQDDSPNEES